MYIGIDPGLSGACAVLATDGTLEAGVCVAMERICAAAHIRSYVESIARAPSNSIQEG